MKKYIFSIGVLVLLSVSQFASASLIIVSKIVVTPSSLNAQGWLQVSEVVATQTGTGNDVALTTAGATATGSSNWPNSSPNYAIDGISPAGYPNIFHSYENDGSSFLNIFLAAPTELDSLTLFGRNNCCSTRDIFDIALYDMAGGLLFEAEGLDATGAAHRVDVSFANVAVPAPASVFMMVFLLLGFGFYNKRNR
ncbi:hypothetical protein CW745_15940 [Psychromonas sp. psych-6C06]|uniref:hypothetical protein n=1 Tax=Psychromonas sp. psych-6C06 TaxID=2058089 RepID=UPI000C3256EC|nr:hypothetical protein [Psychromonas sp. psych-6C06]PKF60251.1 hypothetical protein CW745_15940 [Psychromonas sp. psych-6C06]